MNCILNRSPMPIGYIAEGDYASDCIPLASTVDKATAAHINSCEDTTFWELHDETGKVAERPVIVGCDAGRKQWNTVMGPLQDPSYRGTLWLYVPKKSNILGPSATPNKAHQITLVNYPEGNDLHPLGLEIWPSHAGNSSNLYVVNHARDRTYIEQFLLDPSKPLEAVYVRSISSPYLVSPNALALTSPDSFYATNDHLFTRRLPSLLGKILPAIETFLAIPLGYVNHVTLNPPASSSANAIAEITFAKPFIPFPNGIGISSAGTEIAVVSTNTNQILFYERNPATTAFGKFKYAADVPFSPDNVVYTMMDGKEIAIVGGHPNFPDLAATAANETGAEAQSWVVAIVPKDGADAKPEYKFDLEPPVSVNSKISKDSAQWTMKTLFQSDGKEDVGGFGGTTGADRDPETGALYIPGIYAKGGMLVCVPGSGIGKK